MYVSNFFSNCTRFFLLLTICVWTRNIVHVLFYCEHTNFELRRVQYRIVARRPEMEKKIDRWPMNDLCVYAVYTGHRVLTIQICMNRVEENIWINKMFSMRFCVFFLFSMKKTDTLTQQKKENYADTLKVENEEEKSCTHM